MPNWFNKNAQPAAEFYTAAFPDSRVTAVIPDVYRSAEETDRYWNAILRNDGGRERSRNGGSETRDGSDEEGGFASPRAKRHD